MRGHSPEKKLGWRNLQGTWGVGEAELEPVGEKVEKRRLVPAEAVVSGCQAAEKGRWNHMKTSTEGCKVGEPGGPLPAL